MEYQNILTQIESNILTVTINRPSKMNALNQETLSELRMAVKEAYNNPEVYGILVTGSGEKAFVAGADIAEFTNFSKEQGKRMSENGHATFNLIEKCPKPVIAAINGFALGGGCELALACHLRIASENARFSQPEINLGIIPGYGGTQRLVQTIGKTKAFELLMTGEMINATQAVELGLVNYVTSQEELLTKSKELLNKITSKGPETIRRTIECVNAYFEEGANGFEAEIERFADCFGTDEFKEGTQAFLNKQKPDFRKAKAVS